jgi:hypothetical protein
VFARAEIRIRRESNVHEKESSVLFKRGALVSILSERCIRNGAGRDATKQRLN